MLENKVQGSPFDSTEQRIMSNALFQFCKYGYYGTSVQEIAEASQITKPALYYYFVNKEELYRRLAHTSMEEIFQGIKLSEVSGAMNRAVRLIEVFHKLSTQKPNYLSFIYRFDRALGFSTPETGISGFLDKVREMITTEIMAPAIKDQEVHPSNAKIVGFMLFAIVNQIIICELSGNGAEIDMNLITKTTQNLFLNQLAS
jgi:AcrR family transcriptional regulator